MVPYFQSAHERVCCIVTLMDKFLVHDKTEREVTPIAAFFILVLFR
jgi:hypothetical protein